jgi:hypothetical protein
MLAMPAVFSLAVMLLWNALFPGIFRLPALNYWQTAGLLLVSWILFGGLGGFGGRLFMPRGGYGGDERLFRHGNPLREKWMNMTDKEVHRKRKGLYVFPPGVFPLSRPF